MESGNKFRYGNSQTSRYNDDGQSGQSGQSFRKYEKPGLRDIAW